MKNNIFINRNFMFLWAGRIISLIGDKFYAIALAWWILQKTGSPKTMGFFLLVTVLPGLIVGFFAGTAIDRQSRKSILIITDIIRGLLVLAAVVLSAEKLLAVWHIFIIGAALSAVTAFFDPAVQAIIPQVVEKEKITQANSLNQMISGICTVIGPVLGASAISLFGTAAVFLFNSLTFFISALLEMMVRPDYSQTKDRGVKPFIEDLKEGLLFLKSSKDLVRIIIIIAVAHFFMGSLMVQLPFLANGLTGSGVRNLGCMETMLGAGLLIGAVYISKKKNNIPRERNLIILILSMGLCCLAISALLFLNLKAVVPYMLTFMVIGCMISGASVFWQSLIQFKTPEHMTGRIFGISTLAANVSMPAAYAAFGVFMTYCSINILLLLCGFCLMLFAIILFLLKKVDNPSCSVYTIVK